MPSKLRLVVSGATGRMGKLLARLAAESEQVDLLGGIAREDRTGADANRFGYSTIQTPEEAEGLLREANAVVDFSAPELLHRLLSAQLELLSGRAVVVGTTGLGAHDLELLEKLSGVAPVLVASNFSFGMNLLASFVEQAAGVLGEEYDIEIVEAHHRGKADAPSGTALELGRRAASGRGGNLPDLRQDGWTQRQGERPRGLIGLHAVRGGDIVGEHRVMYISGRERIELSHTAMDRSLFADGALRAARWLVGRPAGMYSMRDVLGLV